MTTTNGAAFGKWLSQVGVSPESFAALPEKIAEFLWIDWQDGDDPAISRKRLEEYRGKPREEQLATNSIGTTDPGLAGDRLYPRSEP